MKVSVLKKEGLTRELEVTIPASDIQKTMERELTAYGKKVKIDGFRSGKIPMQVLKNKYGKMLLGEVLDKTVQETTAKALKEQDIRPAMQPKVKLKDGESFDEGKDLTYTMTVEVLPPITLTNLEKLAIEKPVAKVEDKAVDETLDRIVKNNRNFTKVEEERAAVKGDIMVMNFRGQTSEGVSLPAMSGDGMQVELGSGQLIPGFEDQLIGCKVGQHVHVNVTFPADYGMQELADKDAMFHVDITELRIPTETKLDDELAKKLGFSSVDTLKDAVIKEISQDYDQLARMHVKRAVLDALDETHDIEMPQGMVDLEFDAIVQQMEREKSQAGEKLSDEDKADLKPIAERRVRLGLVLAEIGRENKVEVSNDELHKAILQEAKKYPGQEMKVLEFYSKNPQVIESFRAPLFEEKVIDFVLSKAQVTEKHVTIEDLTKDEDELPKAKSKAKKK